jgi:tetratricopeptide (TPR) repeat protein
MRVLKWVGLIFLIVAGLGGGMFLTRAYLAFNSGTNEIAAQYDPTAKEGRGSREQPTERVIAALQQGLEKNRFHAQGWSYLGAAFLQRVRENGDPSNYARAEEAFEKALELDPNNFQAVSGMGGLELARHRFRQALEWGERGRELNAYNAGIYGVLGDAYLELGEYDAAFEHFQTMVDTRPDLSSYARVAYARELLGDRAGAKENMQAAVNAGAAGSEARSWALAQLGNLNFDEGNFTAARDAYQASLQNWNDYPYARGGLARVSAAEGDYAQAIATYTRLIDTIPLPEFVIALGDVYAASGDTANAEKQYALVDAMQALFQANGVDTDAELALYNADHAIDLDTTLALAKRAYENRPGIPVADTLAWTYYQTGDFENAKVMMERALALGTQNALMFFHAGMIHYKLGDASTAKSYLRRAMELNPRFSVRYAGPAQETLSELEAAGWQTQ